MFRNVNRIGNGLIICLQKWSDRQILPGCGNTARNQRISGGGGSFHVAMGHFPTMPPDRLGYCTAHTHQNIFTDEAKKSANKGHMESAYLEKGNPLHRLHYNGVLLYNINQSKKQSSHWFVYIFVYSQKNCHAQTSYHGYFNIFRSSSPVKGTVSRKLSHMLLYIV